MRILGVDPGLHITGWGIVNYEDNRLRHISHGKIITKSSDDIAYRLNYIYKELSNVIEEYGPTAAAIEQVFVNSNPASSLKLGMARGTAICCIGIMNVPLKEYTPNAVKKAVVGVGHATKDQVAVMVQKLLNCGDVKADAADALAVAICRGHNYRGYML